MYFELTRLKISVGLSVVNFPRVIYDGRVKIPSLLALALVFAFLGIHFYGGILGGDLNDSLKATVFLDVTESHANYEAIDYVKNTGIVSGYADGSFKPDNTINRAEFTKIVVQAAPGYEQPQTHCFPDVQDQWFAQYVCEAKSRGVVSGYPDGLFRPENPVTFVEGAKIIAAAFGYTASLDPIWYRPYIQNLQSKGAIPTSLDDFSDLLTRGEMAEMIYRLHSGNRGKSSLTYEVLEQITDITRNATLNPIQKFQQRQTILASLPPSLPNPLFPPDFDSSKFQPPSLVGPPPTPPGFSSTPVVFDQDNPPPPPYEPDIAYTSPPLPPPPPLPEMVSTVVGPQNIQDLYSPDEYAYFYAPDSPPAKPSPTILIFSDNTTYSSLTTEIERLATDIRLDLGTMVDVYHDDYGHAYDVQAIIKRYANDTSKTYLGAILIGDVPPFYQEDPDGSGELWRPTDYFYQDLTSPCTFNSRGYLTMVNTSKEPCAHNNADYMARYFTGRITPPIPGAEGVALVKKYLDNNHAYRTGEFSYDERVLVYPAATLKELAEDTFPEEAKPWLKFDEFEENRTNVEQYSKDQIDFIRTTDFDEGKRQYLEALRENTYEAVAMEVHGSVGTQWIGGSVDIQLPDLKAAPPNAFFIDLTACSNGNFSKYSYEQRYMAGWYLFTGKAMLVQATVEPFWASSLVSNGRLGTTMPWTLLALKEGAPAYDVMRSNRLQQLIKQTFGDPTLRMRMRAGGGQDTPDGGQARVSVVERVDLGKARGGERKDGVVLIRNTGDKPLTFRNAFPIGESVDGLDFLYGFDDKSEELPEPSTFGLDTFQGIMVKQEHRYPEGGVITIDSYWDNPMTIPPGEERALVFSFTPSMFEKSGTTRRGKYKEVFRFITNDPTKPFVEIEVKGEGV